jgi:hypothetical protein
MLLTQKYRPQARRHLHQPHPSQHPSSSSSSAFPLRVSRPLQDQEESSLAAYGGGELDLYPRNLDFDFDAIEDITGLSVASSPASTQSLLSRFSSAPPASSSTAFDGGLPDIAIPRRADLPASLFDFSDLSSPLQQPLDESALATGNNSQLMNYADAWSTTGQLTPKSVGRFSHHRESSLSSLGSAGPASPYSQNTSNPHIAATDSVSDRYPGLATHDDLNYQLAKDGLLCAGYANYAADPVANSAYAASQPLRMDGGLLPPRDYPVGLQRSRPVSVAASAASDPPAAHLIGEPKDGQRRKPGEIPDWLDWLDDECLPMDDAAFSAMPKLDRTMSDVYNDELYSPDYAIASSSPSQPGLVATSPSSDLFAMRMQAANSQRLTAVFSSAPSAARGCSPFRRDSPLAPTPSHDFSSSGSATQLRFGEEAKAKRSLLPGSGTARPQDISPRDPMLEFDDAGSAADFPLFPPRNSSGLGAAGINGATGHGYGSLGVGNTQYGYVGSQLLPGVQVPQQYPFVAQPRRQDGTVLMGGGPMAPPRLSMEEPASGAGSPEFDGSQHSPAANADSGTYSCTYHGCTQRFDTPALLQKHKREGHRQAHGLSGGRRAEAVGMTVISSQAGPHRCDRINPSTGKSCNVVFSRPYDLTRHEDTIHNARKQKVRCELCTEEKTFSRADALARHFRVCHPEVDLPGKRRKRTETRT